MKFYKENNINPAASCLPMLAQFPVFFSLYFVLRHFAKHAARDRRPLAGSHIVPNITDKATRALVGLPPALRSTPASQIASTYFMSATMDKTQR